MQVKKSVQKINIERTINHLIKYANKLEDSPAESLRTRQELLDREEKFRTFIDTIDFLIFILDFRGNILLVNKSVVDTLGYKPHELIGENILKVHPADRREEAEIIVEEMAQGKTDSCSVPLICKDGRQIPIETRVVQGKWGGQDVLFGITKKLSELKASEKKFAIVFDASPVLIALTDLRTGRYVNVNRAFLKTLGFERRDVVGKTALELGLFVAPSEREQALERLVEEGRWRQVQVRAKDGRILQGFFSGEKIQLPDQTLFLTMIIDSVEQQWVEKALHEHEEELSLFFTQSLDGFFFMMLDEPICWDETVDKEAALDYVFAHQRITKVNDAMLAQYGAERDEFLGLTPNDFFAHDLEQGRKVWREFFDDGRLHVDTEEMNFAGEPIWIEGDYICLYDDEGRITGHFGVQREITKQKQALNELGEINARQKALFDQAHDAIFLVNPQTGLIFDLNAAAESLLGRSRSEMIGAPYTSFHPSSPDISKNHFVESFSFHTKVPVEGKILTASGEFVPVEVRSNLIHLPRGNTVVQMIVRDITERKIVESLLKIANKNLRKQLKEIKRLQQELKEQVMHDPLTGLYNRRYLDEMIQREFSRLKRAGEPLSVMMIDADRFKDINDTYGHAFGDFFLKEIANALNSVTRLEDIVCRYGGDEFLIVLPGADIYFAQKRAEEIRTHCEQLTLFSDNTPVSVSLSFGVASYPNHADDIQTLIYRVDQALYRAKNNRCGRVCIAKRDDHAPSYHIS